MRHRESHLSHRGGWLCAAVLGGWSARLAGAPVRSAIVRVVAGGLLAMGLTTGMGTLFGVTV
jgi:VIT1/CCC1 family predicted Fe2+/Mn2+ transporter